MMEDFDFNMNITIVGLGLIGGSIAHHLKKAGFKNIFAVDKDEDTLQLAKDKEIIKAGFIKGSEILDQSDLIFICLYPEDVFNFIAEHIYDFKKGAIITDVCGIKADMHSKIISLIPDDVEYVGGHPMAGKAENGLVNATDDLLIDANYLLIKDKVNKSFNILKKVIESIGCRVIVTKVDEHDEMIAFTSQLPHIIASAMMQMNQFDNTDDFVGNSFDEFTRISLINEELWSQLFLGNRKHLIKIINKFKYEIDSFLELLVKEDIQGMKENLRDTKKKRQQYLKNKNQGVKI